MMPVSDFRGHQRYPRGTPWLMREDIITYSSAMAEFIGTLLLQLFIGNTSQALRIAAVFTALMASFARHSGGHLNPAITLAAGLSGHLKWRTAGFYMLAQFLGALAGAAIQVFLTPDISFGEHLDTSCHQPSTGLGGTELYLWETLAAFVFVYILYPAMMTKPGYGPLGPLFAGVALYAVVSTAGPFTGVDPLNPALTFAGSLVFDCVWRYSWMYWLAQFTGAGLAALLAVGVFGQGPNYMTDAERAAYDAEYSALSAGPETGENGHPMMRQEGGVAAPAGAGGTVPNF